MIRYVIFIAMCLNIGARLHSALEEVGDYVEPEFSLITGGFVPTRHSSQAEEG